VALVVEVLISIHLSLMEVRGLLDREITVEV
jgi:hypothetical protein